jgi:undecaprenyl-diphosphatase
LPLAFIVSLIAAKLYYNPRPFVVGHFTPVISHAMNNGFPSDHTLLSAAIASLVWAYSRRLGLVFFGITLLIGLSRVYLGVHHLVDIVGAIVIAIICGYMTNLIIKVLNGR